MKKIASIDIGSNTLRLLILEVDENLNHKILFSRREITRLGEGMDTYGKLVDTRISATLSALSGFKQACNKHGNIPIHAVATSAVREASNGKEFVRQVKEKINIEIEIIPWEEEARLTLEGVFWKIPHENRNILTFDIGGGSTEFILSNGKRIINSCSSALGVVRLTEKFIHKHPIDHAEYENLTTHLSSEFEKIYNKLSELEPQVLIGTAGTVTTLAAIKKNIYPYESEKIHGTLLYKEEIETLSSTLKKKSLPERLEINGLEKGREDLIIAGTAIILETMQTFRCDPLMVSEYSLREGIISKVLSETAS